MVGRDLWQDKPEVWFAPPPWKEAHPQRQTIEQRLPSDHLARRIDAQVNQLNLQGLIGTYTGHGTPPLRPDLMLKIALYEMACGKPSPVEWCRDARDCDTVQWLGRGIQPSRTACYDFWYRVAPFFDGWNQQVLGAAIEHRFISAEREAQDGTTIAACASRHRLLNAKTLALRCQELDQQLGADQQSAALSESQPTRRWMSRHPRTRRAQRDQYQRASERMAQLQAENQRRRACHRQKPEKNRGQCQRSRGRLFAGQAACLSPSLQRPILARSGFAVHLGLRSIRSEPGCRHDRTIGRAEPRIHGPQAARPLNGRDLCLRSGVGCVLSARDHVVCARR